MSTVVEYSATQQSVVLRGHHRDHTGSGSGSGSRSTERIQELSCNRMQRSYLLTVSRPCSGGTARRIQDSLLVSGVHQPSLKETFITSECLIPRTCCLLAPSVDRTRKVGGFSSPESWAPLVQSNSSPYRDSSKLFRVKSSDLYRLQMLE